MGWREGELYQNLAARGVAVCAADVRGTGDLLPEFGRGAARYTRPHAEEEDYAWASLMLGKPLVGQRVTDILALAAALRARLNVAKIDLAAQGRLTVPALFAAALDPAIASVYLAGGLVSFQSVVETEEYTAAFGNFVPRLLLHTDLPEVAASLAPRRLRLAGTVNAAGATLPVAEVRRAYPGDHVVVLEKARWDEEI